MNLIDAIKNLAGDVLSSVAINFGDDNYVQVYEFDGEITILAHGQNTADLMEEMGFSPNDYGGDSCNWARPARLSNSDDISAVARFMSFIAGGNVEENQIEVVYRDEHLPIGAEASAV